MDDDDGLARDRCAWVESDLQESSCYTESMMTNIPAAPTELSDRDLLARIHDAVRDERAATARLIELLMELDARRLYLGEGCSSLFTYCTQMLHLSEHAAYNRIETARAARRFPMIFDLVESGAVTLTTIRLLAPHLTTVNHSEVLERARHKSKREVEVLVATLSPRPDVPSMVRKLPTPVVAKAAAGLTQETAKPDVPTSLVPPPCAQTSLRPAEVKPIAPERYKIQFTWSRESYEQLRRAQDLLRHTVPNGDPAVIFERALGLLVAELERTRLASTQRPRAVRLQRTAGTLRRNRVSRISPCGPICLGRRDICEQSRAAVSRP